MHHTLRCFAAPILLLFLFTMPAFVQAQIGYTQTGGCSYYADAFNGRNTTSGDKFDNKKHTCAHLKLPFGTILKVTNLQKNKVTFVRVNDRGPHSKHRILDVSKAAAKDLDLMKYGVAKVKIEVVGTKDSTNFDLMKERYAIPDDFSETKIEFGKYYNVSGTELMVKKAYSSEVKTVDNFTDAILFAKTCLDAKVYSIFFKMVETGEGHKFTFYYGAELYETRPLEILKHDLQKIGIEGKIVKLS
jgi:rare lipoprotein A